VKPMLVDTLRRDCIAHTLTLTETDPALLTEIDPVPVGGFVTPQMVVSR